MIWQSSSEADSQAASESELAVQAAAAVPAESDSDSGTRESRPTWAAVTVTGPWLGFGSPVPAWGHPGRLGPPGPVHARPGETGLHHVYTVCTCHPN